MGNVLKIRDENGNFVGIPTISGADGKSAYESAIDGGFMGTEEEFNQAIAELRPNTEHTENKDNPHEVTAKQVGALPNTGGTVNGDVDIKGAVRISGAGYGDTSEILHDSTDATVVRNCADNNFPTELILSNEGKVMKDKILVLRLTDGGVHRLYGEHNKPTIGDIEGALPKSSYITAEIEVRDENSETNKRYIELSSKSAKGNVEEALYLKQVEGETEKGYRILHEGVKPSGNYSGNSNSDERKIATGGVGNVLLIISSKNDIAWVSAFGARYALEGSSTASVKKLDKTEANFENGVLTLNTTNIGLNKNGVTYYWQVL